MKKLLFGAALALGVSLASSNAHALYPGGVCGPGNQGETVVLEDGSPSSGSNRIWVYQCWGTSWSLMEYWICSDNGWGYSCIAV